MGIFPVLGVLFLVFVVAVLITRHFKEMKEDQVLSELFLLKVAIPLATIALIVIFSTWGEG